MDRLGAATASLHKLSVGVLRSGSGWSAVPRSFEFRAAFGLGLEMPFSSNAFDYYISTLIGLLQPASVCDIGPGAGKYGRIARDVANNKQFQTHVTAVEIDESYVKEYKLNELYDDVIVDDAVNLMLTPQVRFDLVIFGDCIEHMRKSDGGNL
jgi:2-polyprenyl-3-methyl-5-hydroxy-6-metoxy-1,4-benzoquinol methylase